MKTDKTMEPSKSKQDISSKICVATKWKGYIKGLDPSQRPVVIQEVPPRRPGVVNHTYIDYSRVPPPTQGYVVPTKIADMSFPQKLYHILCQPEYEQAVCWMPHGRAFKVRSSRSFEVQVCPQYFGHASIFLFKRELFKHGFRCITKGQDRNCECARAIFIVFCHWTQLNDLSLFSIYINQGFYHELLLRGRLHLCAFMPRGAGSLQAPQPDPENEPDFYGISILFPLHAQTPSAKKEVAMPDRKPGAVMPQISETTGAVPLPAASSPAASASGPPSSAAAGSISLPPLSSNDAIFQHLMPTSSAASFYLSGNQQPTSNIFQPTQQSLPFSPSIHGPQGGSNDLSRLLSALGGSSIPRNPINQSSFMPYAPPVPPPQPPPLPPSLPPQAALQALQSNPQQLDLTTMLSIMVAAQRQGNAQQNNQLLQAILGELGNHNDANAAALLAMLMGSSQPHQQNQGGNSTGGGQRPSGT